MSTIPPARGQFRAALIMKKTVQLNVRDMLTVGSPSKVNGLRLLFANGTRTGGRIRYILLVRADTVSAKKLDAIFK